jgi:hypothetical protein
MGINVIETNGSNCKYNNTNSIQILLFMCRVNSRKANYRHSTMHIMDKHNINQRQITGKLWMKTQ